MTMPISTPLPVANLLQVLGTTPQPTAGVDVSGLRVSSASEISNAELSSGDDGHFCHDGVTTGAVGDVSTQAERAPQHSLSKRRLQG